MNKSITPDGPLCPDHGLNVLGDKPPQPSPAAVELANKTWGEIRIALEARAKAAGVSPFNVIGIEHKFTSAGIEIDYQDKYNGKFHKTILKGWTHQ